MNSSMVVKGSALPIGPKTPISQGQLSSVDGGSRGTAGDMSKVKLFTGSNGGAGPTSAGGTGGPYIQDCPTKKTGLSGLGPFNKLTDNGMVAGDDGEDYTD